MSIAERIAEIRERMDKAASRFGHRPEDITLVGVTKTVEEEAVREGIQAGLTDIGENRVQEILRKKDAFDGARIHMIGRLQSNKVRNLTQGIHLIQSVDRESLLREMERIGAREVMEFQCLFQVNIAGEDQKGGMGEEEVRPLLEKVEDLAHVRVRGLMMVAPFAENVEEIRWTFRKMRKLYDDLKQVGYNRTEMKVLSMGMTHDFEVALEEGANMVRIGSAIFGERNYQ